MLNFPLKIKGDRGIWSIVILLGLISILVVYSSIVTLAYKHQGGNTLYYLFRHSIFMVLGFAIIYGVSRIKFTYFSKIALIGFYISIPLLVFTLFKGENINDASRWIRIPIIGWTFQTSDLAKLTLIMYIARILAIQQKSKEKDSFKKGYLPLIVPIVVVCLLIFPANFSTSALLFTASFVLMFIGGVKLKYLLGTILVIVVSGFLFFLIGKNFPAVTPKRFQTWVSRVESFTGNETKENYQAEQSKIAIATGGVLGKGPGKSTQRNFLPHPYSDFIYAIVIEEYGLAGGIFVLLLYLMILFRSIKIIVNAERNFAKFLVAGICFLMVFQGLINMAVAVGLMPVTGQPLPLISMGGTSTWFTCLSIGIILSVSSSQENSNSNINAAKA